MKIITKSAVKLPKRSAFSKKGDNGRVLIVGGSEQYTGALALAGMAALRSGVDSVVVAAPEKVAWAINCLSPDLVTHKLKGKSLQLGHFPAIRKLLITAECLLIGGGVKEQAQSMKLMKKIINEFKGFKVLDAAALFAFAVGSLQNAILTPNSKEFRRLKKYCDIKEILNKGNIIIAKSPRDIIFYKNRAFQNRTGNAGLTKAGTGDVLAGLIAGFLAQSKDMLQSAINGVYFLGLLGDALYKQKKGYFYLASDLVEEVKRIKNL